MKRFDHSKYTKIVTVNKPDRRWPDRVIEDAPAWCSVICEMVIKR